MRILYFPFLITCLLIADSALAGDGEALAKKSYCTHCHDVNKKKVGPAFRDVAAKYKKDKGAQAALERKVRYGGRGVWGNLPMPASAKSVSDSDIKDIVQWILAVK